MKIIIVYRMYVQAICSLSMYQWYGQPAEPMDDLDIADS